MSGRRIGCGTWMLVIFGAALLYGFITTREGPGTIEVQVEASFAGPCDGDRSLVIDPGSGGAQTVRLDRGEATANGCRFAFSVEIPESDRYRVTVPGTDLPARTVLRGAMDERAPDGTVQWVMRVAW